LREEQGGNGMNGNSEPKLGGYEYVLFLGIVMFAIALRRPLFRRPPDRTRTLTAGPVRVDG
jgi:hypothetical protein